MGVDGRIVAFAERALNIETRIRAFNEEGFEKGAEGLGAIRNLRVVLGLSGPEISIHPLIDLVLVEDQIKKIGDDLLVILRATHLSASDQLSILVRI